MKELFLSQIELQKALPWSKNVVTKMIKNGIFVPIKNPVGSKKSKMFFWRPQVEEAVSAMINTRFQLNQNQEGKNGQND